MAVRSPMRGASKKIPARVSQAKLSQIVGFSVVSLNKWRTLYDDFPQPGESDKLYDTQKVLDWMEAHPEAGKAGQSIKGKREDLMCENLAKRNALLDRQIDEADKKTMPIESLLAALEVERSVNVEMFRKRLLSELPAELDGKPAAQISERLGDAFDAFLQDVQDSIPKIIAAASGAKGSKS